MDVLDKTGLGTLWNKIKSFAYSKAQTDSLLGGKVGTSDTIPGERVGKIRWGKHVANGVFPVSMGMIAGANRLIFLDAQYIGVEYSTDSGTTWTDYGLTDGQKRFLFCDIGFNCYLGHHPTNPGDGDRLRITVTVPTGSVPYYAQLQEFYIFHSTKGNTKLEGRILTKDFDAGSWSVRSEWLELTGYSGGADISTAAFPFGTYNSSSAARLNHVEKIMFEFRQTVKPGNGSSALVSYIRAYGLNLWSSGGVGMRGTGHLYAYDALQNATFPAEVRATRLVTGGGTDAQLVTGTGGLLPKSSLAAASHTHSRSQITDFAHDHDAAYAAKSHTHTTQDVAGLYSSLSQMSGKIQDFERDMIVADEKGAANGVATLDSNGKIPTAQLPDNAVAGLSGFSMTVYRSSLSVSSFGMSGTTATVARVSSGVYKVTLSSISTCSFGNVRIFLQPQGLTSGNNGYTACLLTSQTSNEMQFKVETTSGSASDNWGKMNILCIR